jgi:hypothetical protein
MPDRTPPMPVDTYDQLVAKARDQVARLREIFEEERAATDERTALLRAVDVLKTLPDGEAVSMLAVTLLQPVEVPRG